MMEIKSMSSAVIVVLAFLIAPLPAPLLYFLAAILFQKTGAEVSLHALVMIYFIGLPLAYLAVLVVGVPMYFLYVRLEWEAVGWYLFGGALAGLAVWVLISSLSELGYFSGTLISLVLPGTISGLLFYLVLKGLQGRMP